MDKEIIDFYQSRNLPIENLIRIGQRYHGLKKPFVEEALIGTYQDYQDGKIKKDISIGWSVWSLAKLLSGKEYAKKIGHELKEKKELIETVEGLEDLLQMERQRGDRLRDVLVLVSILFPITVWIAFEYALELGVVSW